MKRLHFEQFSQKANEVEWRKKKEKNEENESYNTSGGKIFEIGRKTRLTREVGEGEGKMEYFAT